MNFFVSAPHRGIAKKRHEISAIHEIGAAIGRMNYALSRIPSARSVIADQAAA